MEISAVSPVLKLIGELLTDEVTSLWGVEEQVDDLQRELQWMQSFLREADTRKIADNEVVRTGVAEIRELAYDAEDVIESFVLKVASKRKEGFCNAITRCACFLKEGWLLHKTKSGIEKITARIKKLKSRLQMYDVRRIREELGGPSSSSEARWESRRPYPHIIDDHVVGLDDDINKLVSILVDDQIQANGNFRVISICGMGGLGKTTLAKAVYHHSKVRNQFDRLALVYVSQQWQKRRVWEDILSGLISPQERGSKLTDEELADKLFNFLKDKKCLVILDDIWSIEAWDTLKAAFPMRDTSSKILLTSRNMNIVHYVTPRGGYLYALECLSEKDSWELFQKFAFPDRDSSGYIVDSKKEELGKDMVKACAGLPLAIIVLAGILSKKSLLNKWLMVAKNVKSFLNKDEGRVSEQVLALSYEDLPPYLKPCFLYLSHFPEDFEIRVERLIQLWVAEGFVSSDERGESMEDMAESHLNELVERCMVQVGKRDATLRIKTCRMHDLMRDLCLSKAKQESFVFIIDHSNSFLSTRKRCSPAFVGNTTHAIVRRMVEHEFTPIQLIRRNSHLRSFLFFDFPFEWKLILESFSFLKPNVVERWDRSVDIDFVDILVVCCMPCFLLYKLQRCWSCLFKNFKMLRVLGFEGENDHAGCKLRSGIGNLIHLRFLSLRGMKFLCPKLPSSLGNLRCLQTLDLRVKCANDWSSIYIPNVIWRLEQLRHLYLPEYHHNVISHKTKLKLHTLRKLRTLVNFSTGYCFIQDVCSLINLRKLKMLLVGAPQEYHFEDLIISCKHISSLTIECDGTIDANVRNITVILSSCLSTLCELSLRVKMPELPDDLHRHFSNSNIAYLCLDSCYLEEDPMPKLEKLPNLRILKLKDSAFMGTKMVCSAKHFPKLDSLTLEWLENLEEWEVEEGAMPVLRGLEIYHCSKLEMLPEGIKFITTLQELRIKWMPGSFKSKLERGGSDFYKVQHIPSIIFS